MKEYEVLSNTEEAANYLGYSFVALMRSRQTGKLGRIKAPAHYKYGRFVKYKKAELEQWLLIYARINK